MTDDRQPDPTTQHEWEEKLENVNLDAAAALAQTDAARRAVEALKQRERDARRRGGS